MFANRGQQNIFFFCEILMELILITYISIHSFYRFIFMLFAHY